MAAAVSAGRAGSCRSTRGRPTTSGSATEHHAGRDRGRRCGELLHERHAANESLVPARVLNLVVVADREWKGETANRLDRVGRYHASRTVLCTVEESRTTLDARRPAATTAARRGLGVIRERIEIDVGPGPSRPARLDHRSGAGLGAAHRAVVPACPTTRRCEALLPDDRRDAARLRRCDRSVRRAGPRGEAARVGLRGRSGLAAHDPLARAHRGELRRTRSPAARWPRSSGSRSTTGRARRPARCCWPDGWPHGSDGNRSSSARASGPVCAASTERRWRRGRRRARARRSGRPRAGQRDGQCAGDRAVSLERGARWAPRARALALRW